MKSMSRKACATPVAVGDVYCPNCGSPCPDRHHARLLEISWVSATLVLIIWLVKSK